jgi:hypothetical protein
MSGRPAKYTPGGVRLGRRGRIKGHTHMQSLFYNVEVWMYWRICRM